MKSKLKSVFFVLSFFICTCLSAQIEVAHLSSKGFSATGFGGFLNFGIPVSEGSAVTTEAGFYVFKHNDNNVALVPLLLGYRYTLNGSGTGLYIEPTAGYSIGATDIQKYDEVGHPISTPDGDGWLEQKAKGVTRRYRYRLYFPVKNCI